MSEYMTIICSGGPEDGKVFKVPVVSDDQITGPKPDGVCAVRYTYKLTDGYKDGHRIAKCIGIED